ncbi:MAG: protein kinase domain-containing protein [Gemmataceae bacterium]
MPQTLHPGTERLAAYMLGSLRAPELEQVENHLSSCPPCRADFASLEEPADSFVACLRGAAAEPSVPGLRRVVEAAGRLPGRTTPGQVGPLPMVAGRELIREIGRGGLGVVYLVTHPGLGALQAVKRPLGDDRRAVEEVQARFRREVRAVGQLRHDHIVRALDAGADAEGPFLVLEYLDGMPLNKVLERDKVLAPDVACEVVRQAALGLQHAHEKGLVHRDLKPGNLMLARVDTLAARVVIIDWGLAKMAGDTVPDDAYTSFGTAMGTPDYLAPEQARDAHSVDIRADIYSLGVTLYALLAGKPPFAGMAKMEKLVAHQERRFPAVARADLPPGLLAVLGRMTEKDPGRRFATPAEAAAALGPFCPARPCLAALLGDLVAVPERPTRRRFLIAAGVSVAGVSAAFAVGWATRGKDAGKPAEKDPPVRLAGEHKGHCASIHFTPDGQRAVSESGGAELVIWDLKTLKPERSWLHTFEQPFPDMGGMCAVSPDGKRLAVAGLHAFPRVMMILRVHDVNTGTPAGQDFTYESLGRGLAFSPDGKSLAVVALPSGFRAALGAAPEVNVIELATRRWKALKCGRVSCLAFAPDGKTLVGGDGTTVRSWDLTAEAPFPRDGFGHEGAVDAVATDGDRIYSTSRADRTARVWRGMKDQVMVKEALPAPSAVAIWPGGRVAFGGRDGAVVVYDLSTGKELYRHRHEGAEVTALALSADGRKLLAALTFRSVFLHTLPEG